MRIRILSRASALAVLQADLVSRALARSWPDLQVARVTRTSEGDRDGRVDLWAAADKGVFTTDLSQALVSGDADVVVHSWKDLPLESCPGTTVAATIERADPRDVLLVRRDIARARPDTLRALTSSPRRAWQLETCGASLMPWPVTTWHATAVRGNIPTRLRKLTSGEGDALVVAKAALDRLLSDDAPADTVTIVRSALSECRWMVLPLSAFPTAPAQGALALEVADGRADVHRVVSAINDRATWNAVARERDILRSFGGGCREAVGATVITREYGDITSVRAHLPGRADAATWLLTPQVPVPRPDPARLWPRPEERHAATRHPLDVEVPPGLAGLWVSRAEALPARTQPGDDQFVWAAGRRTWERLASRGVWVHGSADGLGDAELPAIDLLAARSVTWTRLTHAGSDDAGGLATYEVRQDLPGDLAERTHFFWTSGSLFLRALAAHPRLRHGWHASGPGRTARVIRDTLASGDRTSVWLDYTQWHQHLIG